MYTRSFLSLGQSTLSVIRYNPSILKNGSHSCIIKLFYDSCFLRSLPKKQIPDQARSFKICHALRNDFGDFQLEDTTKISEVKKKPNKGPKISITYEGKSTYMYYKEAEKYAKRNGFKLVKLDNLHYEFQRENSVFIEKSPQKRNTKKIILRDTIANHDLQNKVKYMLKIIEKKEIICIIESNTEDDKMEEVSNFIVNSALKDFVTSVRKSAKKTNILLRKKPIAIEQTDEVQSNNSSL